MRYVQFDCGKGLRFGVELSDGGNVVDLSDELGIKHMLEFLEKGEEAADKVKRLDLAKLPSVPSSKLRLLAPITKPDKVICIGMNYRDHCEEQGAPVPKEPVVFNKFPSCIIGDGDPIPMPSWVTQLDWEVELAIVIGRGGRDIPKSEAMSHVFGFTTAHDVSERDWQLKRNGGQWLLGKAMDGFCPLGPAIVTCDEIGDPHNLGIRCSVNGTERQNSNTKQLVFKTEEVVEWCSKFATLLPGDVILTGTPPGVGVFMKPPIFLKAGDEVTCSIDKIGSITNKIK